jgi:hypothetical protein
MGQTLADRKLAEFREKLEATREILAVLKKGLDTPEVDRETYQRVVLQPVRERIKAYEYAINKMTSIDYSEL